MHITTLTQKANWIRDWEFKDAHIIFVGEMVSDPTISVFSAVKKMFIKW